MFGRFAEVGEARLTGLQARHGAPVVQRVQSL